MYSHDDELEAGEVAFRLHCLADDISTGRIPRTAHRGLTPLEESTGVNFLAISDDASRAATALAQLLGANRAAFLAALRASLETAGTVDALVEQIQSHQANGITSIPGAADLLSQSSAQLRPVLEALLVQSAGRVATEAKAQGVEIPLLGGADPASRNQIARAANRLALRPLNDGLLAISEAVVELPNVSSVDTALGLVDAAGRSLSEKPLLDLGMQGASTAVGLGRQAAVANSPLQPAAIYASELLDQNTCGPCSLVDGKEYKTLEAAKKDYPFGIYWRCEGGLKCRGTVVVVWPTEADPNAR